MEKNFRAILRRFGTDIYLQRVLNSQKGNEIPQYSNKLERYTVRSLFPNKSEGAVNVAQQALEGDVYNVDMVFYFQADANPTSGDRIYEEVDRFPNKQALYSIDYAVSMRGVSGKIIYWAAGASRVNPN